MKYTMAHLWGVITLLTLMFAALRYLYGSPEAIGATLVLVLPVHAIVYDLVDRMGQASQRGSRVV